MSGHICAYWIREDGRQRQCGVIATHYRTTDARKTYYLCPSHARQVEENTKGRVVPSPLRNPDQIEADAQERIPTTQLSTFNSQPPQQ